MEIMSRSTLYTIVTYAAAAGLTGTLILTTSLWYYQTKIIYPSYAPSGSRKLVPKPTQLGMPYEDVTLTTPDKIKIKAYVIPARRRPVSKEEWTAMTAGERKARGEKEMLDWAAEMGDEKAISYTKSRPTVVIFHANAGNMGHRIPIARKFNVDLGCNVFMLSYRGYGLSEGHASEHGMRIDVKTALKYIQEHPLLGGTKLVLYGQSIGGAVCLYAASKHPDITTGVIIENTFLSLPTLIPFIMPQIPKFLLPILLTERWDATKSLPHIPPRTPILMLSGKRDLLIPPTQMAELRKLRERDGGDVRWREFDGEHNDTYLAEGYWTEVEGWLKECIEGEKGEF